MHVGTTEVRRRNSGTRRAAVYVITMGCGDACPVCPGENNLDWELTDPGAQADAIRQVVEGIDGRVPALWSDIRGAT